MRQRWTHIIGPFWIGPRNVTHRKEPGRTIDHLFWRVFIAHPETPIEAARRLVWDMHAAARDRTARTGTGAYLRGKANGRQEALKDVLDILKTLDKDR